MASRAANDLLARARALPTRERARMVRELIDSLDEGTVDEAAGRSWATEIERRARDVLNGKAVVVETGEMFRRVRDELSLAPGAKPSATRGGRGRAAGGRAAVR